MPEQVQWLYTMQFVQEIKLGFSAFFCLVGFTLCSPLTRGCRWEGKHRGKLFILLKASLNVKTMRNQNRIQKFPLLSSKALISVLGPTLLLYPLKLGKPYIAFNRQHHTKRKKRKGSLPAGLLRVLLGSGKRV